MRLGGTVGHVNYRYLDTSSSQLQVAVTQLEPHKIALVSRVASDHRPTFHPTWHSTFLFRILLRFRGYRAFP